MAASCVHALLLLSFVTWSAANTIPSLVSCCNIVLNTCVDRCEGFFTIKEELPIGTPLFNLSATDSEKDAISFFIKGDTDALTFFKFEKIDDYSAILKIKSRIDLEANPPKLVGLNIQYTDNYNTPNDVILHFSFQDVNDNAPLFMNQPYRCSVNEGLPNVNCTDLEVWDKDQHSVQPKIDVKGTNFPASMYKIIMDPPTTSRGIGKTWKFHLEIQQPLDYEKERIFQLTLTVMDGPLLNSTADFSLTVLDVSDEQPVFMKQPYDRKVAENSPPGTKIVQIFAQDGDRGVNNPIVYSFISGNIFNDYFNISTTTGEITVAQPIDRENKTVKDANGFIELSIKAKEVSNPEQLAKISESTVVVHLTVTDVNDYIPRFKLANYSGEIMENTQKNVAVLLNPEIECEDLDSSLNGIFTLSVMEGSNVSEVFSITPEKVVQTATARLRVKDPKAIDYEKPIKEFHFLVVARETQAPFHSSSVPVTLRITDMNDNFPTFSQSLYTFNVSENSPNGTFVGRVEATDADSGAFGLISYTIQGSMNKFSIDKTSGEIRVAVEADKNPSLLDRDAFITSIPINVRAQDGGNQAAFVQVVVKLLDENDNNPVFLPSNTYFGTILEQSTTFPRQIQVSASDRDEAPANTVNFAITEGNYGNHFAIDPTTGIISVPKAVDLEKLPPEQSNSTVFNLTVEARDQGVPVGKSKAYVIIQVQDINDNYPVFGKPSYSVTIPETTPYGTVVATVFATDADRTGPVIYRINEGAADKFVIDGINGTIRVDSRATLEPRMYNITVLGVDRGAPSKSTMVVVSVTVTDVNEKAPYFPAPSYTKVVEENNKPNSIVVTYPAKDSDSNANLVYSIIKERMVGKLGPNRLPASVYESLFTVNNQGQITAVQSLDRETMDSVTIPLLVNDTNAATPIPIQTASTIISLIISDQNDEMPKFQFPNGTTSFSLQVLESLTPPAATSLTVQAVDRDKNDVIRYALQDTTGLFTIAPISGVVSLEKPVNYETMKSLTMKVTATDTKAHVATADILVTVIDVNDNNPVFTKFQSPIQVSEGEPIGHIMTTVQATDADSGAFGTVGYFLTSDGDGSFEINQTTGALSLKKALDRDVTGGSSFRLGVEARDNIGGTYQGKASRLMEVTVTDINDNKPTFSQQSYNITKQENLGANQKLDEIAATDKDEGDNAKIVYKLEAPTSGPQTALTLLRVTTAGNRAILSTAKSLKNAVGCHSAILVAEDMGKTKLRGTTLVTLCVLDVNDVAPKFVVPAGPVESVSLKENERSVTLITVRATDSDKGPNGMVRYKLGSSNGDHINFTVNSTTGVLSNVSPLDREKQAVYKFTVFAFDMGDTPLTSSAAIHVYIIDTDDHPPSFPDASKEQELTVPENANLDTTLPDGSNVTFVGQIGSATDKDTGNNSQICYFIVSAASQELFFLNKTTGKLYLYQTLDREKQSEFVLVIKAVGPEECKTNNYVWQPKTNRRRLLYLTAEIPYSKSDPTMLQLKVKVADKNDNPPKFDRTAFFNGVNKDSPPLTEIINFKNHVTDKDVGNNSRLFFSLVGNMEITEPLQSQLKEKKLTQVIILNQDSGILSTGSRVYFQEDWRGYFRMRVRVYDGSYEAFADTTIYLLSQSQRVVVVFRDSPANVGKSRETIAKFLSDITGLKVNVDSIVTHKKPDGTADSRKTDMYIHAYDPRTNKIISASDLIKLLDSKWESLKTLYNRYNVISVNAFQSEAPPRNMEEVYKIALILVACVISAIVIVTCIALWSCRKMYRRKLKAANTHSYDGGHGRTTDFVNHVPGTNMHCYEGSNPIWGQQYKNMGANFDTSSERDRDSLDDNALMPKIALKDVDEQEVVLDIPAETDTDATLPNGVTNRGYSNLDVALSRIEANVQKGNISNGSVEPDSKIVNGLMATSI